MDDKEKSEALNKLRAMVAYIREQLRVNDLIPVSIKMVLARMTDETMRAIATGDFDLACAWGGATNVVFRDGLTRIAKLVAEKLTEIIFDDEATTMTPPTEPTDYVN